MWRTELATAVRGRFMDRSSEEAKERIARLKERLPPGFDLEKALADLHVLYSELQAKVLREGLPQPWPKSAAPAE